VFAGFRQFATLFDTQSAASALFCVIPAKAGIPLFSFSPRQEEERRRRRRRRRSVTPAFAEVTSQSFIEAGINSGVTAEGEAVAGVQRAKEKAPEAPCGRGEG
jgi:hypothetical protein